jgi:nucleoid-associated protein YgaU
MINTSWKTTVCAVASGLLLAIGACSSSQQEAEQETLAISQGEEATLDGEQPFEVAEAGENEAIDDALAETLAAVEGAEGLAEEPVEGEDEMPSVEDVLSQAEQAANSAVDGTKEIPSEEVGQATEETLLTENHNSTPMSEFSGETFTYTVQKGDWLAKISKHIYGSAGMWKEVAQENGLDNPHRILPGQKITFKVTNDQSRSFSESYAQVKWHDNTQVRRGEEGVYDVVVAKGDSLSKIAERFFGDYNGWQRIYEANKDQITNPNLIFVGQKLTFSHSDAVAH